MSWALDFMSDVLYRGRRFRTLNILDEGVREALDIVIDTSIPSGHVVRALEQLTTWRGAPAAIRCDNGPEILSQTFVDWCQEHQIEIRYIQPGKPNQNAYIERLDLSERSLGRVPVQRPEPSEGDHLPLAPGVQRRSTP